jgi:NADH:ubiquinone oxidoreductase subunit 4 (subunit M)
LSSGKFFIYSSIGGLILGIAIVDRYTKLNQNTDTQFKVTKQHRTLSVDFVRQNGLTSDGLLFHNLLFYNSYLVVTDTTCYVLSKITGSKITF